VNEVVSLERKLEALKDYIGAALYRQHYTGSTVQAALYRQHYTGSTVQAALYRQHCTGSTIQKVAE